MDTLRYDELICPNASIWDGPCEVCDFRLTNWVERWVVAWELARAEAEDVANKFDGPVIAVRAIFLPVCRGCGKTDWGGDWTPEEWGQRSPREGIAA